MVIKTLCRPALIDPECLDTLDREYRAARDLYHDLLDFEDEHEALLNKVADEIAPGIVRCGRIVSRLRRRKKRWEKTPEGSWAPDPKPELLKYLSVDRLPALRDARNADPRWKAALKWADEEIGEPKLPRRRRAKDPSKVKKKKKESQEAFQKRFELLTNDESDEHFAQKIANPRRESRREVHRKKLYANREIYWGTYNGLIKSVEQARKAVLEERRAGRSAQWRRPRWSDPSTIYSDASSVNIVEKGPLWWTIEMRLGNNEYPHFVRFRTKGGNWHDTEGAKLVTAKLTRRRDGERWKHSVSLTYEMPAKHDPRLATKGIVAFDWGHREHGHDRAHEGMRAFTWIGDDGQKGEVILPRKCRSMIDGVNVIKKRLDDVFNVRKRTLRLPDKNRHTYRNRLMKSGVRTEEEMMWLRWEMHHKRRAMRLRKRVDNLRTELYRTTLNELRRQYLHFAFEGESVAQIKEKQKDEAMPHRKRANRDMCSRYDFLSMCEQSSANVVLVSAYNTTKECPDCGFIGENGPELLYVCPGCGLTRDKDYGACRVILGRAREVLADRDAAE